MNMIIRPMSDLLDGATVPWDVVARHHHKADLDAYRKAPDPVPVVEQPTVEPVQASPRGVFSFVGRAIDLTRFGRRITT